MGFAESQPNGPEKQQPYHLDPTRNKVESIINHFNKGELKDGVAELKSLEEMDNKGNGAVWQRHIAVINGSVDLKKLGLADADQIFGVDRDGSLITIDKSLRKEQFRSPETLALKREQTIMPYSFGEFPTIDPVTEQILNTRTYKERIEKVKQQEENPQPKGTSAEQVKGIISDFNGGNIAKATEALKKLQAEDNKIEPELWLRHIAAINANIDLAKMGMNDTSQILGVDDKGRLLTASKDLTRTQVRSAEGPSKIVEETDLKHYKWHSVPFTGGGDAKLFDQAQQVATLLQEADNSRKPLKPGDNRLSFTTSSGEQREIDVHVPPGYDLNKPMPAFYVLHNALLGDDVAHGEMNNETNINEKADKQGFIVVYPLSEIHSNDANTMFGSKFQYHSFNSPGAGMNVTYGNYDDVDYTKEGTNLIDSKLNIDPNARFLMGFSEGGEFAPHVVAGMKGYWAGMGLWHPTTLQTEKIPDGDPIAYAQITSEQDGMLRRFGGTSDMLFDLFGSLYPKLQRSEPTMLYDKIAAGQGCTGTPTVQVDPAKIVTTFKPEQCKTGRPVTDIDMRYGQHAVDGDTGGFMTWLIGKVTGSKIRDFDSTQYLIDYMMKHKKDS